MGFEYGLRVRASGMGFEYPEKLLRKLRDSILLGIAWAAKENIEHLSTFKNAI